MPIRASERARYPANWPLLSRAARARAGDVCQRCGVPNGALIRRAVTRDGVPVWRLRDESAYVDSRSADDGSVVADSVPDVLDLSAPIRVILTVAHLDHTPENCHAVNLRAWCQRCHNRYDGAHRRAGVLSRSRAALAVRELL